MKTRRITAFLLVTVIAITIMLTGCDSISQKEGLEVYSGSDGFDVTACLEGFEQYFVGAKGDGRLSIEDDKWVVESSNARYKVIFVDSSEKMPAASSGESFTIVVFDSGSTVYMDINYTTGGPNDDSTITNPNVSGLMSVKRNISFVPNATEAGKERFDAIASILHELLVEIEG